MTKIIFLLLTLVSMFSHSQTNTITSLNKILAQFQRSYEGTTKYGVKTSYVQKNFKLSINAEKTKITYSWDVINLSTNKKSESYYHEAKITDIDFDNIVVNNSKDNSCIIIIRQIRTNGNDFTLRCNGANCYAPTESGNNFGIEFTPNNCAKYHEEFLELFKKLNKQ